MVRSLFAYPTCSVSSLRILFRSFLPTGRCTDVCRRSLQWALLAIAVALVANARAQTAHFSGTDTAVGNGFGYPIGVAVDLHGDVFVADCDNDAVKEIVAVNGAISSTSTVITVGNGFNSPRSVAVDTHGNVFVADSGNDAVKKILAANGPLSSTSTVITVGSGFNSPTSVAVDTHGDVFVADSDNDAVKKIVAVNGALSSTSTVITVGSGFNSPTSVAVDAHGNVFVADSGSGAVKEILTIHGMICAASTVMTVNSEFRFPRGVTVDESGNVFVADHSDDGDDTVKEILAIDGTVSTTSTVIPVQSGFIDLYGVAVDASGNIFAADTDNNIIKKIELASVDSGMVNVNSTSATISIPFTFDSTDTLSGWNVLTQGAAGLEFTEVTAHTTCSTSASYSAGDSCSVAVRFSPRYPGLRMGAVQLLDASGTVIATAHLRGTGSAPQLVFPSNSATKTVGSGFSKPISVTVNGSGDVFVADSGNHKVYKIAATGGTVSQASTVVPVGSGFNAPAGVAVDASGDIFATDVVNNAVYEIVAVSGAVSSASTTIPVGSGFNYPWGVAVDASGNVFVADSGSNTVKKIVAVNGTVSSTSTVIPVGCGFSYPTGVAVDSSGNIFVADYGNSAIKEILAVNGAVSSTSTVITVGSGFSKPINLAIDAGGDVFVADSGNNAIYEIVAVNGAVSSTSIVIPVGSGFSVPPGVAVDASGNVFVADDGNSAVKEMMLATPPSLSFATTPINTVSSDSPQTVTIANNGNAPLTFVLPSLSGYYNPSVSANFSWNSSASTCMQASSGSGSAFTLSEGASCTIAIDFTPASAGSITGSTVLTNDSLNAPAPNYTTQAIGLSGTGTDAVTHFSVSIPSTATSGSSFDITVTAFDSANNTLSSYSGTVHFASSDGAAALPADSMLNHGVGTFSATLKTSGTQVITVTDMSSSITGTSNVITVSPAVVAPMISFTPRPNTQTYGTPIIAGSLDAMATYDGKPLTGAFTYTATVNGNPETLVAGTTVLPAGFYTITAKFTPTDSSLYQPVSLTASYSVTKAGTTVLLNAGNSQITPGTSVTLNAQVASATTGTPSGTISFYDGASLLNTITLAGGVASYSTASLSAGTHSLTAVYSGDANFTTSSTTASTAVSVMALDFTLTVAGPSTQTVLPSRSSTYQVAVTPLYGAYPDTVSFAASGLPSGATATFSPSSITVNGGAQTITVTIQNTMSTAMKHDSFFSRRLGSASLALLLLPLFGARDMRRYGRWLVRLACLLILVGITAGSVTGCGFSKGSSAQNYSVTIMATSGTVQHAATVTLRVQ